MQPCVSGEMNAEHRGQHAWIIGYNWLIELICNVIIEGWLGYTTYHSRYCSMKNDKSQS